MKTGGAKSSKAVTRVQLSTRVVLNKLSPADRLSPNLCQILSFTSVPQHSNTTIPLPAELNGLIRYGNMICIRVGNYS